MPRRRFLINRLLHRAPIHGKGTAGMEAAPAGRVDGRRHLAGQDYLFMNQVRMGGQGGRKEGFGVRVQGILVEFLGIGILYYLPQVHHRRLVSHVAHCGQVQQDVLGQILWSVDLGEPTFSEPIVLDGVIYLGAHFKIVALEASSGRTLWTKTTTGPVQASLAAAGDYLYVGLLDHRVLALDLKTGETRWEYQTGGIVTAPILRCQASSPDLLSRA